MIEKGRLKRERERELVKKRQAVGGRGGELVP